MKQRILFLIRLFLIILGYFFICKFLFLIYNWKLTTTNPFGEISKVFWHGLRLDLSTTGYVMILPMLVVLIASAIRFKYYSALIRWYVSIILGLFTFLLFSDLALYDYWGFRLDITPLLYLKHPKEAMASVSLWVVILQVLLASLFAWAIIKISLRILKKENPKDFKWVEIPVYAFLFSTLIIPIRGGFGIAPINVGSAYFSENIFLNHAGINMFWNLGHSFVDLNYSNKYNYFKEEEARQVVIPYLNNHEPADTILLNTPRPNIIVVMIESFTANAVEAVGGMPGITPNFNKLSKEGILFTNFYASGDRSEKGLVSILGGYPAQTTLSVIKDAAKTQQIPKLPMNLKKLGYKTSFYYGGDPDFANMRAFLVSAGFNELITQEKFDRKTYNSKWGAHDEVVFSRLSDDLNKAQNPFFKMIFTLSSHEPFEIPRKPFRKVTDNNSKYYNAFMYTDSCIGDFILKAKKQPWWNSTLIILVADHGVRVPDTLQVHNPEKFHIPMLWLGGAVSKPKVVTQTASQIDIPVTVLNQMGINDTTYIFSRNIFSRKQKTDAFYIFNNGIGLVNDTTKFVYDCTQNSIIEQHGKISDSLVRTVKSYIQYIYSDINKK